MKVPKSTQTRVVGMITDAVPSLHHVHTNIETIDVHTYMTSHTAAVCVWECVYVM